MDFGDCFFGFDGSGLYSLNSIISKGKLPDPYRNAYIAGFVLFSIISLASAAELYVIITMFLTDG